MPASSAAAESASVSSVMKFCATHDARDEATQSRRRSASTLLTKAAACSGVGAAGAGVAASSAGGGGAGSTRGGGGGGSTSQAAAAARTRGRSGASRERFTASFYTARASARTSA